MEVAYFIKFAEPHLSSGIHAWTSLHTRAPAFLIYSADRDLKFLKKERNRVSKQAMCSQITPDRAPVGKGAKRCCWRDTGSSCSRNAWLYLPQVAEPEPFLLPKFLCYFSSLSSFPFASFLSFFHWLRMLWLMAASLKSMSMKMYSCPVSPLWKTPAAPLRIPHLGMYAVQSEQRIIKWKELYTDFCCWSFSSLCDVFSPERFVLLKDNQL